MAHHHLDNLLRRAVLHEVHRKRISKSLRGDRTDGKRDAVTLCALYRLAYPGARGVRTGHVPDPFSLLQPRGGQIFPQPLHLGRVGQRHGAWRVQPRLTFGGLLLKRRPAAPPDAGHVPALLQGVQHHERRLQRTAQLVIHRKILHRQRQHLVEPSPGVPLRVGKEGVRLEFGNYPTLSLKSLTGDFVLMSANL